MDTTEPLKSVAPKLHRCVCCHAILTKSEIQWEGQTVKGYICPNGKVMNGPTPPRCGFALGLLNGGKSGQRLA